MVVFSEGASASALGVATFQTALISALLLSGLLCDRFGIGVDEKNTLPLSHHRCIICGYCYDFCCVTAVAFYLSSYLPFFRS